MNTLVIQNGSIADAMITTSILHKLVYDGHNVHCITNRNSGEILSRVRGVSVDFLPVVDLYDYDLAVNLSPDEIAGTLMNHVNAKYKRGYGFDGEHIVFLDNCADIHYRVSRLGVYTDSNLFQLTYGMVGLTWNGEGYDVGYFPRNRQKKSLIGLCVRDERLRKYIVGNLRSRGVVSPIPIKQNVLKQFDEINRCKRLITDDEGCMHIGLSLRKQVEYITKRQSAYAVEMFGCGNHHVFNTEILGE